MKKIKLFCTLASFVMLAAVTLTGCGGSSVSYKEETKDALHEVLDSALDMAGEEFYIPAEEKEDVYAIVEKALSEAKISDKELNALIKLPEELGKINFEAENPVDVLEDIMDTFYATKVTHTKIATFVYVITVETYEYADENFKDELGEDLELIGKIIDCVPQKDFVNVAVAMLDSAKTTLYSDLMDKVFDLVLKGVSTDDLIEGEINPVAEMPTKAEVKTLLNQYIKNAEDLNKIWSEKNVKSAVTIFKNFITTFAPDDDTRPVVLDILDDVVTYVKVAQKVQISVLKAIDDKMLDVFFDMEREDDLVIAVGKLVNAAISNTGLTKKLILDCEVFNLPAFEIEEMDKDLFKEVLGESLDIIFKGAPKFKGKAYGSELDQNDEFTALLQMMVLGMTGEVMPL